VEKLMLKVARRVNLASALLDKMMVLNPASVVCHCFTPLKQTLPSAKLIVTHFQQL